MKSENIGQLAAALAQAQGKLKHAIKDADNPFFKSKYADLGAVWDACRSALAENKLSVSQLMVSDDPGRLYLDSLLMHASGEWLMSRYPVVPVDAKPQSLGSAITYARRYALGALVGIASEEDDDGNAASGRVKQEKAQGKSWGDLPKSKQKPLAELDSPPPGQVTVLPDSLCLFYEPFKQYAGVSISDLPMKALEHIGQHIQPMLHKSDGTRKQWYEAIANELVNELADRVALGDEPEEK